MLQCYEMLRYYIVQGEQVNPIIGEGVGESWTLLWDRNSGHSERQAGGGTLLCTHFNSKIVLWK